METNHHTKRYIDYHEKYVKKYGELFWLRFYYNLRMLEEKREINTTILNSDFRRRINPYYRVQHQRSAPTAVAKTIRASNQELISAPSYAPKVTRELRQSYNRPND